MRIFESMRKMELFECRKKVTVIAYLIRISELRMSFNNHGRTRGEILSM